MLGPPKRRDLDRSVVASLEMLVPKDHFYRHLEKVLDLSFVRDWVKALLDMAPDLRPKDMSADQRRTFETTKRNLQRRAVKRASRSLASSNG
jgi:hypothetical protein